MTFLFFSFFFFFDQYIIHNKPLTEGFTYWLCTSRTVSTRALVVCGVVAASVSPWLPFRGCG